MVLNNYTRTHHQVLRERTLTALQSTREFTTILTLKQLSDREKENFVMCLQSVTSYLLGPCLDSYTVGSLRQTVLMMEIIRDRRDGENIFGISKCDVIHFYKQQHLHSSQLHQWSNG